MGKSLHSTVRRSAGEVKRYRMLTKIIGAGVAALSVLLILVYVVTILYGEYGAFTVSVMKFDKVKYSLVLSEDPKFAATAAHLKCSATEEVTNISGESITDEVDTINGQHNGANYIAYTFYCKNNGKMALDYSYELYITNITKDLDKAVRVRLYINGKSETFARVASNGNPESGTTTFQSLNTIVKDEVYNFKPNEITKFTVVIWLEGNDPDCVDERLGGEFKIDMSINVLNSDKSGKSS